MVIAILNYGCTACEIIKDAPDMETSKEVETFLKDCGYNLDDIYYMCDAQVSTYSVKDLKE